MKKFLYLLMSILIMSCSSEDSDNNCNVETMSDIDGYIYDVVSIGNQCWAKTNLNVSKFSNGEQIPEITSNFQWASTSSPGWCYYENSSENGLIYGKLYNHYAINDPRNIAPEGWRVPSAEDWEELFEYLGGVDIAGKHMKVSGEGDFGTNNTGTNSSGFSALPGGRRVGYTGASNQGTFSVGGQWADIAANNGGSFYISGGDNVYFGNWVGSSNNGNSVRLIRE